MNGWRLYLLSSHTEFERTFGKRADKKRKLYNPNLIFAVKLPVHSLISAVQPVLFFQPGPFLGGEGPVQPRSPVPGDQGRLNGDGTAAAEGVAQGVPPPPERGNSR